jgi:hypothetical protein
MTGRGAGVAVVLVAAVLGAAAIAFGIGESQRSAVHVNVALAPPSIRESEEVLARARRSADAVAKVQATSMQTAIETLATDQGGSYAGATLAALERLEPTLGENGGAVAQEPADLSDESYTVESESRATGDVFAITSQQGAITRTCWPENAASCPNGKWQSQP